MTTSDPRAEQRDENPDERRGLGKRILDAVLGDPHEQRPGDPHEQRPGGPADDRADVRHADPAAPVPADTGRTAESRATDAREGYAGDGPRGEYASYEQAMRDHAPVGTEPDRGTAAAGTDRPAAARDTGYAGTGAATGARTDTGYDPADTAADARRDATPAGYADPRDAGRDAGREPGREPGYDPGRDAGYDAGREPGREPGRDAGYDAGRDAGYDARRDAGPVDRPDAAAAPWDSGYDHPGVDADRADVVHDLPRTDSAPAGAGADRDFVTGSYDPDRDRGYDPQAAGTAVETDPSQGPVARNTNRDVQRDTDYDSAQDTGYVDAGRAEADRTTGRRDDDYDTGRVDADRAGQPGDRVVTEPVDPDVADRDRTDRGRGAGAAAGAAGAAGAAAAAAFGAGSRDRDRSADRDTRAGTGLGTTSLDDRRSDDTRSDDARFSDVDDTATVDATGTGRSTPDTGAVAGAGDAGVADEDGSSGTRERLVPADRADDYGRRWDALKGDFVDEPRRAVRQADELVGEVLDELQRLFADQRRDLEQSFNDDRASTEDLRLALRRYRSFFDRLLSF